MNKRTFLRSLGIGIAGIPLMSQLEASPSAFNKVKLLKAKPLQKGDTIGIITPAGALESEEAITTTKEVLQTLGYKVKEGKHIRSRYGSLAGRDQERLEDLHNMFRDPDVQGVLCVRGGTGASRLLPLIDFELIRQNPKVLLGYSDITALIMAFYTKAGLVSFHGQVGTSTWSHLVGEYFNQLIVENGLVSYQNPEKLNGNLVVYKDRIQTLQSGTVEGTLLGGNLTLLSGLCGSPYLPDFKDSILFIEEINEKSDRIDRMFCQLMNSGILSQIKGFIFGKCTDCGPSGGYGSFTLDDIFNDYIKPLGIPAFSGAVIGHINDQFILPVGVRVKMDADKGTITLLERALQA